MKNASGLTPPDGLSIVDLRLAPNAAESYEDDCPDYRCGEPVRIFRNSSLFSRDGTKVLFSSDRGLPSTMGLDLWEFDLQTSQVRNLTDSPDQYNEHARYSPDGSRFAWGSSQGIASYRTNLKTLASDAYVMNADGSGKPQRLTHFNEAGLPQSTALQSGIWPTAWSPDGTQLVVAQQPIADVLSGRQSANKSWLVNVGPAKPPKRDR